MALSDGSREQILLEAQFLNNLAGNLVAVGVFGPLATAIFVAGIVQEKAFLASAFAMFCFFGAFVLHLLARLRLRELDK